jgi:hypothetical protein
MPRSVMLRSNFEPLVCRLPSMIFSEILRQIHPAPSTHSSRSGMAFRTVARLL